MKRREFIWLLGASGIWAPEARAQQALRTIAIVGNTPVAYGRWATALVERLGQLGWIDGRTLQVEYRWSEGRRERVAEIASELVSKKVDLFVTYGGAAVILKQVTASIPTVFVPAVDPVSAGLVVDFAHPGGNVTGMSVQQAEIGSKKASRVRGGDCIDAPAVLSTSGACHLKISLKSAAPKNYYTGADMNMQDVAGSVCARSDISCRAACAHSTDHLVLPCLHLAETELRHRFDVFSVDANELIPRLLFWQNPNPELAPDYSSHGPSCLALRSLFGGNGVPISRALLCTQERLGRFRATDARARGAIED